MQTEIEGLRAEAKGLRHAKNNLEAQTIQLNLDRTKGLALLNRKTEELASLELKLASYADVDTLQQGQNKVQKDLEAF